MNKPLLATFLLILAVALAPLQRPAQAATGIQRCETRNGQLVYTDKPCAAFGATAVPMSGELLTRIAHDMATADADFDIARPDASQTTSIGSGRRSAAGGCARTPTQLAMDLQAAVMLGDVNRIAESYHWVGLSHRSAMRIMDRLQQLQQRGVVDARYYNAQIASADLDGDGGWTTTSHDVGGSAGILQVVGGNGTVTDFGVERYAGCYFVKF